MFPLEDMYVIEVHSGLMEFFYTVARTLCGRERHLGPQGVMEPPLSFHEVVDRVAKIFRDWVARKYQEGERFSAPRFPMHPYQIRTAEDLCTKAELFVLGHELGHVMAHLDKDLAGMPPDLYGTQESFPDAFGVITVLLSGQRLGWRMTYAGALFALRVFACLEHLGYQFPETHPPPKARLETAKAAAQAYFGDVMVLTHFSTIATSFDELMEAVENELLSKGKDTVQTPERVRSRFYVLLEEGCQGHLEQDKVVSEAAMTVAGVAPEVLAQVAGQLCPWFWSESQSQVPDPTGGLKPKMAELLDWLLPQLPEPARGIFEEARKPMRAV
jgi:hypothetical protein